MLTDFKGAGEQEGAGGEGDLGAGGQREENAHDLGWQVVAGAVFDFIDLDGLGRE